MLHRSVGDEKDHPDRKKEVNTQRPDPPSHAERKGCTHHLDRLALRLKVRVVEREETAKG